MSDHQEKLARLSNAYMQYIEGAITYGEFIVWILANVPHSCNEENSSAAHLFALDRLGDAAVYLTGTEKDELGKIEISRPIHPQHEWFKTQPID